MLEALLKMNFRLVSIRYKTPEQKFNITED